MAAVAALFGALVIVAQATGAIISAPGAVLVVVQVAAVVAAIAARRWPLWAMWACLALSVVVPAAGTPVVGFAVGRWRPASRASTGTVVGGLVALLLAWLSPDRGPRVDIAIAFVSLAAIAWLLGAALRTTEEARVAEAARDALLRDRLAEDVRHDERDRLAREMHDVVAHRISLIVLDANRIEAGSAAEPTAVAAQIRDTGRAALDDMREVLGRLRRDDLADGLSRQSFTEVKALVGEVRAVGQPVELSLTATSRQPPDLAERTAVRIVRESLTNAVRHAPGAPTVVAIEDAPGSMLVVVSNEAPPRPPDLALTTGGHGLEGMRERVALVGGEIATGPTQSGGFVVRAVLPREGR